MEAKEERKKTTLFLFYWIHQDSTSVMIMLYR